MVKAYDKIKVYKDGGLLEAVALFDTEAGGSYLKDRVAERLGYEEYPEPIRIPLAVEKKEAEVIGRLRVFIEVAGCKLPEEELIGVVRELRVDAIIGRNLIEKHGILLEEEKISFREYPPKASLL